MTVAGQPTVTYSYDNANQLTSITQGASTVGFTYDAANRRATLTLPNGVTTTYGYDAASELTSLTYTLGATTLGDLTYTYDQAGRRTSVGGSWARTGLPNAVTSMTYDAANQIATREGIGFTYDANGNLTNDGATTYTWNARNQLSALSGSATASFVYDGVGRRRGKTVNGATTNFLYDGLNAAQELAGGVPSANILTGLGVDETLTRTDAGGTNALLVDALGSTLALADASGTVRTQYTFDPFGTTATSGVGSSNTAQFTGRENDATGLYALRARYYSPQLQRFIAEDGIGFSGGDVNLYAYVGNQPTGFRDPTGHFAPLVLPLAGCLGGAAGAAIGNAMAGRKTTLPDLARGCGIGVGIGAAAAVAAGGFGAGAGAWGGAGAAAGAAAGAQAAGGVAGAYGEELSGLGDLTVAEVEQIQSVVNQAGRPLEVVGSAARGLRTLGSDIDYVVPPSSLEYYKGLEQLLPGLDPTHGIIPGVGNPSIGPAIPFVPTTVTW